MPTLTARLAAGERILIDGGVGTELERQGVPMVDGSWSGDAARTHTGALQAVHEMHIACGADLIIANTFASSRHIMENGGVGEHFEATNRLAVEAALAARAASGRTDVVVAGSISTTEQGGEIPPLDVERVNFVDQVAILTAAGVDMIVLEMMRDIDRTEVALEAALATGLPVWLGWSVVEVDGETLLWSKRHTLREGMAHFAGEPIEAVAIMHSEVEHVDAALDVLADTWSGPVAVYAHSGDFVPPNWVFNDVISVADYSACTRRWLDHGVQVIGGCCGIGPDHITDLATLLA